MADEQERPRVAGLVAESRREGLLDEGEEQLLAGALGFEERRACTVLLLLAEVVTLPVHTTPRAVEEAVARTGFSRFPVVDDGGESTCPYCGAHYILRD